MEPERTPGPWTWHEHGNGKNSLGNSEIGEAVLFTANRRMPYRANADLIAAAPDLLESLKLLVDALNRGRLAELRFIQEQAGDAIAKAEGQGVGA